MPSSRIAPRHRNCTPISRWSLVVRRWSLVQVVVRESRKGCMQSFIREKQPRGFHVRLVGAVALVVLASSWGGLTAQQREAYTAAAISVGDARSAAVAQRLTITIDRWTSPEDGRRLVQSLKDGP